MIYLVGQIFVWIAVTFAVAFAAGWWSRGRGKVENPQPASVIDDSEIEEIARERNDFQAENESLRKAAGVLESELETARSTILALEMQREDSAQDLRDKDDIQSTTISGAVDPFVDSPSMQLEGPDGLPDDLRQLKGLGKILEMRLHELGIFHFRQLAGLEGYDFNWLASKLGFSPTRLEELDWVGQAQALIANLEDDDVATLPGIELQPEENPEG